MCEIRWKTASWSLFFQIPSYFKSLFFSLRHHIGHAKYDIRAPIVNEGFDIITVVPKMELAMLRLQARSLARFLDRAFDGEIILVVNDLDLSETIDRIRRKILPEYGHWQSRVRIVPFYHLGYGLDPANGWIFQQALKLAVSACISRPFYVVLDTKNHAIRHLTADCFVSNGRGFQARGQSSPSLSEHSEVCARYFGVATATSSLMSCVPATPFVMHTQSVRELIDHVKVKEERSFFAFFCRTRSISEFLLYDFYLKATKIGTQDFFHEEGPFLSQTIWPKGTELKEAIAAASQNQNVRFFGVHREVLKNQCVTERVQVEDYWRRRGLLKAGETLEQLAS